MASRQRKHLSTQHAITLQEGHVFDALQSDDNVNESQPSPSSAANVSASCVNIEGNLLQRRCHKNLYHMLRSHKLRQYEMTFTITCNLTLSSKDIIF